ncbi:MAG: hypothetical protein KatS3mg068_2123 [Candidatus Sericytochromatia bacterium]|nr:MAG: hypothetical protein KatS3mg068_2123 [Candidatus Sericytochromatia bacterium]
MRNLLEKVFIFIGDLIIGDKESSCKFSFMSKKEQEKEKEENKNIFVKQVWIDGQFWTVMANSEQELQEKVSKVSPKLLLFKEKEEINILNNFYTEDKKIEENDWLQKRDVWINEYYKN